MSPRVREAEADARAYRFVSEAAEREAIRAFGSAWASLGGARQRLVAGEEGLAPADIELREVHAEYEVGLRNTINLLIAEQSYLAAQPDIAHRRRQNCQKFRKWPRIFGKKKAT